MRFKFEAMDKTGLEIKDDIEAESLTHAQTLVRQMGYFITKIHTDEPTLPIKVRPLPIVAVILLVVAVSGLVLFMSCHPSEPQPNPFIKPSYPISSDGSNPFRPMNEQVVPQVIKYQGRTYVLKEEK